MIRGILRWLLVVSGCVIVRATALQCPESSIGVQEFPGICFRLHITTRTWEGAESECQGLGGHLAVVDSYEKQAIIEQLMEQHGAESAWIGGREGDELFWRWKPGNDLLQSQGCFIDQASSPDLSYTVPAMQSLVPEQCFAECRRNNFIYAGLQGGSSCFCGNQCGRYGLGDGCYTMCSGDSDAFCGGWGRNNVYVLDGSFEVWADVQPDNYGGGQACASLWKGNLYHQHEYMKDDDCQLHKHFVCHIESDTCSGAIGGHYVSLSDGCYFLGMTPVAWFIAQQECTARSGYLVNLMDEYQHQSVKTLLSWFAHALVGDVWVGATRKHIQWHTGLEMEYTNWAADYPSTAGGDCVKLVKSMNYRWLDDNCAMQNMFVCESDGFSTTVPVPVDEVVGGGGQYDNTPSTHTMGMNLKQTTVATPSVSIGSRSTSSSPLVTTSPSVPPPPSSSPLGTTSPFVPPPPSSSPLGTTSPSVPPPPSSSPLVTTSPSVPPPPSSSPIGTTSPSVPPPLSSSPLGTTSPSVPPPPRPTSASQSVPHPPNQSSTSSSLWPEALSSTVEDNSKLIFYQIATYVVGGLLFIVLCAVMVVLITRIKRSKRQGRVHPDEEDSASSISEKVGTVDVKDNRPCFASPPLDAAKMGMLSGSYCDSSSGKSSSSLLRPSDVELSTPDLISRPGYPMILSLQPDRLPPIRPHQNRKCPVCEQRVRKVRTHLILVHKMAPGSTELRFAMKAYKQLRAERKAVQRTEVVSIRPAIP